MYSFAERTDTRVMDEPLFGHFLTHTGASRPSREQVLTTMPTSRTEALQTLQPRQDDEILFLKHMANHLEGLAWADVDGPHHRHVILTRHPDGVLPSYRAHIARPTMLAGDRAVVVTAESLFSQPEPTLRALCDALDLPWEAGMLTWQPGGRPEDGVWAPYWYDGVHRSAGWEARTLTHGEVPPDLEALRATCLEHYLALQAQSLTP